MTPEQFERFRDFALRAARTWYKGRRMPNRQWIEEAVRDFIDCIDEEDIECIQDWDNSTVYPEGNPRHGRESWLSYCTCEGRRESGGDPLRDCPECHGRGVHHDFFRCGLMCDMMSEWEYDYLPGNWTGPKRLIEQMERAYQRRDDDREDELREQLEDRWGTPVRCCVRAALDTAVAPSAGVLGFSKADIQDMYSDLDDVPDWVKNGLWHPWLEKATGENGIAFDDMQPDQALVL